MKVYSISKATFAAICLLILSLPVSRHWKLLSTGGRADGEVGRYVLIARETANGRKILSHASEIWFLAGDSTMMMYGPDNYEYRQGKKVRVIYDKGDPDRNLVVTFAGFYLTNYTTLIVVLMVVWLAFYYSFNSYRKKSRIGTREVASSPYRGTGGRKGGSREKGEGKVKNKVIEKE